MLKGPVLFPWSFIYWSYKIGLKGERKMKTSKMHQTMLNILKNALSKNICKTHKKCTIHRHFFGTLYLALRSSLMKHTLAFISKFHFNSFESTIRGVPPGQFLRNQIQQSYWNFYQKSTQFESQGVSPWFAISMIYFSVGQNH